MEMEEKQREEGRKRKMSEVRDIAFPRVGWCGCRRTDEEMRRDEKRERSADRQHRDRERERFILLPSLISLSSPF